MRTPFYTRRGCNSLTRKKLVGCAIALLKSALLQRFRVWFYGRHATGSTASRGKSAPTSRSYSRLLKCAVGARAIDGAGKMLRKDGGDLIERDAQRGGELLQVFVAQRFLNFNCSNRHVGPVAESGIHFCAVASIVELRQHSVKAAHFLESCPEQTADAAFLVRSALQQTAQAVEDVHDAALPFADQAPKHDHGVPPGQQDPIRASEVKPTRGSTLNQIRQLFSLVLQML
jgi:hypothetical protein